MDIKKIKKEIELNGSIRNPTWVNRQFSKSRLFLNGVLLTEETFRQFKIAIKVINEVYENQWDIRFYIRLYNCRIVIDINTILILFEEITIRNRDNKTHQIKNLFVGIKLYVSSPEIIKMDSLQGGRSYLTYAEWQSNYFHSHLSMSSGDVGTSLKEVRLSTFCTGSGEINIYMSDINGEGLTEESFMRFAVQLMSLVNYESIEGTPYRYIRNITTRPSSGSMFHLNSYTLSNFKQRVIGHYKAEKIKPPIDIVINSTNLYELANNENFTKFVYDIPYTATEENTFFCLEDASRNGNFYTIAGIPGYNPPTRNTHTFIFRNESRRVIEIEEPPVLDDTVVEQKIHPDLIYYIKKELEYELNKDKIRQSTINRYQIKSGDVTESIESDPVLVSTDS